LKISSDGVQVKSGNTSPISFSVKACAGRSGFVVRKKTSNEVVDLPRLPRVFQTQSKETLPEGGIGLEGA
jgi:hypothetical protein